MRRYAIWIGLAVLLVATAGMALAQAVDPPKTERPQALTPEQGAALKQLRDVHKEFTIARLELALAEAKEAPEREVAEKAERVYRLQGQMHALRVKTPGLRGLRLGREAGPGAGMGRRRGAGRHGMGRGWGRGFDPEAEGPMMRGRGGPGMGQGMGRGGGRGMGHGGMRGMGQGRRGGMGRGRMHDPGARDWQRGAEPVEPLAPEAPLGAEPEL